MGNCGITHGSLHDQVDQVDRAAHIIVDNGQLMVQLGDELGRLIVPGILSHLRLVVVRISMGRKWGFPCYQSS